MLNSNNSLDVYDDDIIVFTEIWLKLSVNSAEACDSDVFRILRNGRIDRPSGGVFFSIKSIYNCVNINLSVVIQEAPSFKI